MAILLNVQEVVESTAEEASKKLNLNMYDKVGAGGGTTAPPSDEELTAYGVTPDFAEFVRTLNYRCGLSGGGEDWLPWACTGLCRCFGEAPQRLLVHSPPVHVHQPFNFHWGLPVRLRPSQHLLHAFHAAACSVTFRQSTCCLRESRAVAAAGQQRQCPAARPTG